MERSVGNDSRLCRQDSRCSNKSMDFGLTHGLALADFDLLQKLGQGDSATVFLARLRSTSPTPIALTDSATTSPATYALGASSTSQQAARYAATSTNSHRLFALKIISKEKVRRRKKHHRIAAEFDVLTTVQHPFICAMHHALQDARALVYVMDYYTINLRTAVHSMCLDGIVPEAMVRFIASEVILALEFLHLKGFIYRDLKPENIMLSQQGHLVLCDYDLSKRFQGTRKFAVPDTPVVRRQRKHSFVGTPDYIAPEVIADHAQTPAVDWWCLGVLLYECLFGAAPFTGSNERDTLHRVEHHDHVPMPTVQELSKECRSFLLKLLDKRPSHRLGSNGGAAEVKKHPWLAGVDFATILSDASPLAQWAPPPPSDDALHDGPVSPANSLHSMAGSGFEEEPIAIDTGSSVPHVASTEPFPMSRSVSASNASDPFEEFAFFHYTRPKPLARERSMDELRAALAYSASGASPSSTPHATPKKLGVGEREMVLPISPSTSAKHAGGADVPQPTPTSTVGSFSLLFANLKQRFYNDSPDLPSTLGNQSSDSLTHEMSPSI